MHKNQAVGPPGDWSSLETWMAIRMANANMVMTLGPEGGEGGEQSYLQQCHQNYRLTDYLQ